MPRVRPGRLRGIKALPQLAAYLRDDARFRVDDDLRHRIAALSGETP